MNLFQEAMANERADGRIGRTSRAEVHLLQLGAAQNPWEERVFSLARAAFTRAAGSQFGAYEYHYAEGMLDAVAVRRLQEELEALAKPK